MDSLWIWIGFNAFVLAMLALDLGVFHRKSHAVSFKEALTWSGVWVALAMVFNVGLYYWMGPEPALEFFTGYLIEKSLSVDNIFVFVLIFSAFSVPAIYQHRVLFWGVLGALVMRGILIFVGAALLKEFHWIIYIFGAFLVFTGIKMAFPEKEEKDITQNPLLKWVRRLIPVTDNYVEDRFFIRRAGQWVATPLFLVLLLVETTDLIFAVDSIPAIFAVTTDPFIVYTSNVFAILGLRSLYFVLAGVVGKFHYLKLALSVILTFVGTKMLLIDIFKIPIAVSLLVIVSVLAVAVVASIVRARLLDKERERQERELALPRRE
ncbi:TerC family protein [Gloeobacter morelensis]|uniref:TerC family protein n=1 Tax=Gloeobacter morelensis MG652769 TaxID=2781736 RepID=A0ABY3PFX3_9CYAN|nr:TerC family protein [Gloeobacter morelensis]UFP92548.1 TerC family protein [Gloeobacter morelensis MG652769]